MTVAIWYAAVGSSVARDAQPVRAADHRQVTFSGRAGFPTLSSDGERVAYVSDEPGAKSVMVQSLAGGEPLAILAAPEVGHIRWSPDAAELIVWARGAGMDGVYVISHLGGTPRRIVRNQYVACWSPDGSTIAVGSYLYGTILFFTRLGDPIRTIALKEVPGSIWSIDWSPAHDRLVVVSSDHQGRYAISTVGANGDEQTQLLVGDAEIPAARWSPDGDAIYFFERRNQTVALNRMPARKSGSGAPAATTMMSGLESDQSFALSADATRLVYARAPYYSNLWTFDRTAANGRAPAAALTHGTSLIERPRVSPDGSSIVFNMGRDPTAHLYSMSVRDGLPRQLTFGDSFNAGATWSPDGTRLAFGSTRSGTPRIWTMNAAGGSASAVSSGDVSDTFDIAWFPGPHILYQQAGNRSYYDLDPLTREEGFLIDTPPPRSWLFSPAYSPNGEQVAVFWNRRPQRGVWIIDPRSRREKFIYAANEESPMPIGWSVDGTSVYAVIGKPGPRRGHTLSMGETIIDARIIEVFANGGGVRPVAALPAQEIGTVSMAPDGLKFYYTVYSSRSDVWVVDNFDPSQRRLGPRQAGIKR